VAGNTPGAEPDWPECSGTSTCSDIDLLYIRFPFENEWTFLNCLRLLANRHIPTICEFNAPLEQLTREAPPRSFWSLRYKARLYSRNHALIRGCVDHGISVSEELAGYARDTFGLREVTVLPDAGDPELFHPRYREEGRALMGVKDDDFVVFWGGSTAFDWQGLEEIIDAAAQLKADDVKCVIVGDTENLPRGLPAQVITPGLQSYFDMPRFIAGSDVCMCIYKPYDWCPIGFFGSPLKLFDYMACGRAVIASRMGQIAEVIQDGENGVLVNGSIREMAEKIAWLRSDPRKRQVLGEAARESIIRRYNWQWVAEETAEIIEGLLAGRRPPHNA